MKSPVYVYYQLDNFYQNHRRYVTTMFPSCIKRYFYLFQFSMPHLRSDGKFIRNKAFLVFSGFDNYFSYICVLGRGNNCEEGATFTSFFRRLLLSLFSNSLVFYFQRYNEIFYSQCKTDFPVLLCIWSKIW